MPDQPEQTASLIPSHPLAADKAVDIVPSSSPPISSPSDLKRLAEQAALANGLPADFFVHLIKKESAFNTSAISNAGAQGIAQFMPATARDYGLKDPFNPSEALPKSAQLLRDLQLQFGNLGLAAAAYNAGARRVRDWLEGHGTLPLETAGYVYAITGRYAEDWAPAGAPLLKTAAFQSMTGRIGLGELEAEKNWELSLLLSIRARDEPQTATLPTRPTLTSHAEVSAKHLRSAASHKSLRQNLEQSLCSGCIVQSFY